jgi:catechol 2,3-dioxygenase-like lactoylglutathione lyase family enzyme
MLQVKRLAHATLTTPDLERQIEYYVDVLGLHPIERSKKHAVLATRTGLEAIVLEQGEKLGLPRLAFQVAPNIDLGELATAVKNLGLKVERRSGITPGVADAITFEDPKGTLLEIFSNYDFPKIGGLQPTLSLLKLGHVAYRCHDVQRVVKFYTETLGFRISDWRADRFAFLRCAVDHHTINFVTDEQQRLHHIAFEVTDYAEIHRACDHLAKNNLQLVWGPGRHNIGHNVAIYHMNPDRLRVEIFAEMDQMKDESLGYFDPRPWHGDQPQRPKVWSPETLRNYWGPGSDPDLYKNL